MECLRVESSRVGLPFRNLWWGRAHAGESNLVWIRWGQGRELSLLLENGRAVAGRLEALDDGGVRIETPRSRWSTGAGRTLCNRNVHRAFPGWLVWLAGGLAPLRELKLAGAVQHCAIPGAACRGSAVWEEVIWR